MRTRIQLLISCMCLINAALAQQTYYDVIPGNGNGVRFWQGDHYKIHMGTGTEYQYGPVTDYSIKTNMSNTAGRGWTWGIIGEVPVAALNNIGNMKIAGSFTSNALNITSTLNTSSANTAYFAAPNIGPEYSYIHWGTTGDWYLRSSVNTGRVILQDTGGKVGIGTAQPNSALSVKGRLGIRADAAPTGPTETLRVEGSISSEENVVNITNLADQDFVVRLSGAGAATKRTIIGPSVSNRFSLGLNVSSGNEHLTIINGGNVGIGTILPSAKLEVNQTGGSSGQNQGIKIWAGNSSAYFGNTQISLSYGGGGGGYSHSIKTRHNSNGVSGNAIDFYVWQPGDQVSGDGSLNVMTLNGDKVGIGTNSPNAKLHIVDGGFRHGGTGEINIDAPGIIGGRFKILDNGNVGIGTANPNQKLTVNGTIYGKEVKVDLSVPGPDYVFEKDYNLPSLEEIKKYIDANKHLPEVPSVKEMETNGVNLGNMDMLLLKKIEELTLYVIELKKENEEIKKQLKNK